MVDTFVIARDVDGRALKRVAISTTDKLVYAANPDLIAAVESGDSHPVGFPLEDVFEFDEGLMARIDSDPGQWKTARPYVVSRRPVTL